MEGNIFLIIPSTIKEPLVVEINLLCWINLVTSHNLHSLFSTLSSSMAIRIDYTYTLDVDKSCNIIPSYKFS